MPQSRNFPRVAGGGGEEGGRGGKRDGVAIVIKTGNRKDQKDPLINPDSAHESALKI